jgi:hypothetical protein
MASGGVLKSGLKLQADLAEAILTQTRISRNNIAVEIGTAPGKKKAQRVLGP